MRTFKTVFWLVLALLASLAFPAIAHEAAGPIERLKIRGLGTVEYQHLFTQVGEPGESLDAFMVRVAPRLRDYSDATGFEACGVLATDGERFGVVVGSTRAHAACGSFLEAVPAGMETTGETIHSHREGGLYRANENDRALLGLRPGSRFKTGPADEFSHEDFHAPGYLVGATGVWHQAGRTIVRRVAEL